MRGRSAARARRGSRRPAARRCARPRPSSRSTRSRSDGLSGKIANGPAGRKCSSARPPWSRSCATVVTMLACAYVPAVGGDAGALADAGARAIGGDQQACGDDRLIGERDVTAATALRSAPQAANADPTAAGRRSTPSSLALAASAASSGGFSTMWANGSPGSTSPSKVRKTGRTASSSRLSVMRMSRIGCASAATASHTPMVSNSRRAAATMAEARGIGRGACRAPGSATVTLNAGPSACLSAIASAEPGEAGAANQDIGTLWNRGGHCCLLPSI